MTDYLGKLCCTFSVLIVNQVLPSRQAGSQSWLCIRITWKCFRIFWCLGPIPRCSDLMHLGVESGHRLKNTLGESKVQLRLGITKIKKLLKPPYLIDQCFTKYSVYNTRGVWVGWDSSTNEADCEKNFSLSILLLILPIRLKKSLNMVVVGP